MDSSCYVCPYLDCRDARCAEQFTMTNIGEAFRLCVGDHESCIVYHQIKLAEQRYESTLALARSA